MDIFVEHVVKKRKSAVNHLMIAGVLIAGAAMLYLSVIFAGIIFLPAFLVVGAVYGVYWIVTSQNIEYEYIITNTDLDIDQIMSKKRRKRLLTLDVKKLEIIAPAAGKTLNSGEYEKTYKYCGSMDSTGLYYAIINRGNRRELLYFEPNEKMIATFKRYLGSKLQ